MSRTARDFQGLPPIKVIGVGGGGCNAVSRMSQQKIPGVQLVAVNTNAMRFDIAVKALLLAATSLVATSAHAQSAPTAIFLFAFQADTRAARIFSAQAMLTHVEYVSSTLPTMRPSEREWLSKERAAIGELKDTEV